MNHVHIKPSMGLLLFAVVQACILAAAFCVAGQMHSKSQVDCPCDVSVRIPAATPNMGSQGSPVGNSVGREFISPPRPIGAPGVNSSALNEIKQQQPCLPCQNQPTFVPRNIVPHPVTSPTSQPAQKRYQLAIFIDGSAKGVALENWFATDAKLQELRSRCDFQKYTPDSALYKTRYANIVPRDQFPAVLFLKPDGGHVHAAGGNMIPSNAAQLMADITESYKLAKSVDSVSSSSTSGAIKERGYQWSKEIVPSMALVSQSQLCPDGNCPEDGDSVGRPRPLDRVSDLFNREAKEAVFWASPIEIAVYAFMFIIVVLIVAVAIKKNGESQ